MRSSLFLPLISFWLASMPSPVSAKTNSLNELFLARKKAIVKIVIDQFGFRTTVGTGFFVSEDGLILTNRHVLPEGFKPGRELKIIREDGSSLSPGAVLACSDTGELDLCALRVAFPSKDYFSISDSVPIPKVGTKIYVIGHPNGLDFSLSEGLITGHRQLLHDQFVEKSSDPKAISIIQMSTPLNHGNSGGPLFNEEGKFLGVASFTLQDTQGLGFGIAAVEVQKLLLLHLKELHWDEFLKQKSEARKAFFSKLLAKLDPAFPGYEKDVFPHPVLHKQVPILMPALISFACKNERPSATVDRTTCLDHLGDGIIQFSWLQFPGKSLLKIPLKQRMMTLSLGNLDKPTPVRAAVEFIQKGHSDLLAKSTTKEFAYSKPSAWNCKSDRFSEECKIRVENYVSPGTIAYITSHKRKGSAVIWLTQASFPAVEAEAYAKKLDSMISISFEKYFSDTDAALKN